MASPLSPAKRSTLNLATPPTIRRPYDQYEIKAYTEQSTTTAGDDTYSSPFISNVDDTQPLAPAEANSQQHKAKDFDQKLPNKNQKEKENKNMSPPKQRHSRIMSGNELSPLKILSAADPSPDKQASPARASRKSILSPDRRFPVRVSNPISETAETQPSPAASEGERPRSMEDAVRDNPGLARAIEIFEDEGDDESFPEDERLHSSDNNSARAATDDGDHGDSTQIHHDQSSLVEEHVGGPDDTMMSTFSTFSAVPNMTMLARLNPNSPNKLSAINDMTPRARPDPSPSRTPRPTSHHQDSSGNTTNLLMDFTDQLRFPGGSPAKQGYGAQMTGGNGGGGGGGVPATPSRQANNLLDFDIPPLPTPRSIPTITPRELESLKSGFLSEISSLKASLSGKEAEVLALKTAVGDAEKRVGQSLEQMREYETEKEHLSAEKDGWERRSREMESVLRSVKEEIVRSQREREELEYKLSESEARREAAETMAQDAESKLAGLRAGKASEDNAKLSEKNGGKGGAAAVNSTKEVEMAVERVARELHALYKSKHETKVAALKKSYEGRWEKRVRELEGKVEELGEDNERLRLGRDATMTRVDMAQQAMDEERKANAVRDAAQIKELGAEVVKLEAVVRTVQGDNSELRTLLERERVEKGELVILAEEMMSMQSFVGAGGGGGGGGERGSAGGAPTTEREVAAPSTARKSQPHQSQASSHDPVPVRTPGKMRTPGPVTRTQGGGGENFRGSLTRTSGLKAPGSSIVMPGRGATAGGGGAGHERTRSGHGGLGLPRPGSGFGPRGGIMSSIEKMGSHRGRGE